MCCLLTLLVCCPAKAVFPVNRFLQMANELIGNTSKVDCWLCAHSFHTQSWPIGPVHFLLPEEWASLTVANTTSGRLKTPHPIMLPLAHYPTAPLCVESLSRTVALGRYPNCSVYITLPYDSVDFHTRRKIYNYKFYVSSPECYLDNCGNLTMHRVYCVNVTSNTTELSNEDACVNDLVVNYGEPKEIEGWDIIVGDGQAVKSNPICHTHCLKLLLGRK